MAQNQEETEFLGAPKVKTEMLLSIYEDTVSEGLFFFSDRQIEESNKIYYCLLCIQRVFWSSICSMQSVEVAEVACQDEHDTVLKMKLI